ncbi:MAG TPA: sialidase family protein, partial [Chloroflexota bacterium]|nr:sialidase family protein [Chloroflexota bacterium]
MIKHPRSVTDRVFEVWRSPGRFTKNPDVVQLPSGRLLLVYCDNDGHWSQENQILTLLASDDAGQTWFKHRVIAEHDLRKGEERLVTPRLSLLSDGRLVALIDQDDFGHFHEDLPPGILAWWSNDGGDIWSGVQDTGIRGFEPDRIVELPDGRLAVCSHIMRGQTQNFAEIFSTSSDGGRTWHEASEIAHDGFQHFCEGALVVLDGGKTLACVMRDNLNGGYPSWVAFSKDAGQTWSPPAMAPFAGHRPYAKQLPDGRALVTFRNVNGGLGTYAWCGDLERELGYQIGGPPTEFVARLDHDALIAENRPATACRYTLLPPESSLSEIHFEATLKVEGPPNTAIAFMAIARLGTVLKMGPDFLSIGDRVDFRRRVDLTVFRRVGIHHRRGLLQVQVDGETIMRNHIFRGEVPLAGWNRLEPLSGRSHFGQVGEAGRSYWKQLSYQVANRNRPDFSWSWDAASGIWPDDYQRRRLIQIHANVPLQEPWPDNGYSSWLTLPDGRIFFVDYTNCGDRPSTSHLVGVYLTSEDFG